MPTAPRDNPFYGIDDRKTTLRERLATVIPNARLCARRARDLGQIDDDAASYAGGDHLAGLANTTKPFREPQKLAAFFDRHSATECEDVPMLNLDACAEPRCSDAWAWLASVLRDAQPDAAALASVFHDSQLPWANAESIVKLRRPNATNPTGVGRGCPFVVQRVT